MAWIWSALFLVPAVALLIGARTCPPAEPSRWPSDNPYLGIGSGVDVGPFDPYARCSALEQFAAE